VALRESVAETDHQSGTSGGDWVKYELDGLNCASCAAKIERTIRTELKLPAVSLNFATRSIKLPFVATDEAQAIIDRIEDGVTLVRSDSAERADAISSDHSFSKLAAIGLSFFLLIVGMVFERQLADTAYGSGRWAVFVVPYLWVGWRVIWSAFRNITRGNLFDENFLMTLATFGAIAIGELPEAVGVMLFYNVGEYFQDLAVNRSRRSISALLDIRPDYASIRVDGKVIRVDPQEVQVGSEIIVAPGERVPLDGEVLSGSSLLDTSALTGESVPRRSQVGDEVYAGSINTSGLLTIRVTRPFEESSVAKILDLVENAGSRKAATEKLITTFSRYYTPIVVFLAVALATVPPLVIPGAQFSEWLYRALILLVISCPCALVVSIPLGYFGGLGGASRQGILVKGANFLEALTSVKTVVLDKTGTLTRGTFEVVDVVALGKGSARELVAIAAQAEAHSSHPIARSIGEAAREYGDMGLSGPEISAYEEIAGAGVRATIGGEEVLVGNERLLREGGISFTETNAPGKTIVYIARGGQYLGHLLIADELKPESLRLAAGLKGVGVNKVVMLTGDVERVAGPVAAQVGVDEYRAELLPEDKVVEVERLSAELGHGLRGKLAFIGDGINDAPVLSRADIGVAMGALGSDAAIEAADVVIMEDQPSKLIDAIKTARFTKSIIIQNIALALGIKGFFIFLGAGGLATMWEAVFADVGVALLAVANATRVIKTRPSESPSASDQEHPEAHLPAG